MKTSLRVAAASAAAGLVALVPASAQAASLNVTYDAQGTSFVAKTNASINLGPTTLKTSVDSATGALTGSLDIPKTSISFFAFGFLPASADVEFIPAAPITGTLGRDGTRTVVNTVATYTLRLTNTRILGFPTFAGDSCKTIAPISVPAATPAGEVFNLTTGGRLTGTYTIGNFANCGLTTGLINSLVAGGGNTINLNVSNGRIG